MKIVVTWYHRGGTIIELWADYETTQYGRCYKITGTGYFYAHTDKQAVEAAQQRIDSGVYSKDSWKTPFKRLHP